MTYADRHLFLVRRRKMKVFVSTLFFGLSLTVVYTKGTSSHSSQEDENKASTLEVGKPIEREIAGGQAHTYQITLVAGQYAHVVVDQRGIDVVVVLFGPDGKKLLEVDSPNGAQGPEPVSVVAEASGSYRLEVRSLEKDAAAGRYEVKIEQLGVATEPDRSRVVAQRLFAEGAELQAQETAESLRNAADKYLDALPHWRASGDRFGEGNTLSNLGRVYDDLFERQKAVDYYNQSLPLKRTVGDRGGEAATLHNIGTVYGSLGVKQKALDYFNQALPIWRLISDRSGEAITLNSIGLVYSDLGEKQRALDYYNQALPLRRAAGDRMGEANTLNNIGLVHDDLGEKQRALDYYNQALPLMRAIGHRGGEAAALNNIGRVYDDLGEKQKALDYYDQALLIWRSFGSRNGEAYTLNNIGRVYVSLGENQKALAFYNQALPMWRAVGDRDGEANTLSGMARVERQLGHLSEARSHIEAVLNRIESIRGSVGSHQLRASYFAAVANRYEFYIDLLMQMHKRQSSAGFAAAALEASERARARSLLELLAEAGADIRKGVNPKLLESERSLQQLLTTKEAERIRLLNGKHTAEHAEAAEKQIETLANQLQNVEAQIRVASPRYAALAQPQPLTLSEIQRQVLDADTLLLEYALGDERSYLWVVSQSAITTYELPKRAEIKSVASRFYELLTSPNQRHRTAGNRRELGSDNVASALSQELLAPVASELGTKRLIVVSDGALQYIPFAALPIPVGTGQGQPPVDSSQAMGKGEPTERKYRPLIADHEIITLPSASTLAVLRRELAGRNPAPKIAVVLADPVFEATDLRVKRRAQNQSKTTGNESPNRDVSLAQLFTSRALNDAGLISSGLGIPRQPYSQREAEAIKALVPRQSRRLATGFDVNYATATSPEMSNYRIVHFATHGLLNSKQPELSGILLSLVDEQGRPQENGILRLGEIYNLKLRAELVVLSACQTALGKEVKGEGLVGLTRGFMYAGAARVMASLWKVDDEATAELMKRFYQGMLGAKRLRPADALRQAQIQMWKASRWRAPYYWGAFTLQGEWK